MSGQSISGVIVKPSSYKSILEKTRMYISHRNGFFHIVSLNPEIIVLGAHHKEFRAVLNSADITLADGNGLYIACRLLGIPVDEHMTGVDTMRYLLEYIGKERLSALFIGGKAKVAEKLAECYLEKYPEARFIGIQGVSDIGQLSVQEEEDAITAIVVEHKPHFVFASFGSPQQELWLSSHKHLFSQSICMGVGGSFDFLSGEVRRAPRWIRSIGMEWVYRLVQQPWRWRRQLRLLEFIKLVFLQKCGILRIE